MRRARVLALFVALALPVTSPIRAGAERVFKGPLDSLAPFSWVDLDGRRWTERDFTGKIVIVHQWATWCGACVAEFPEIQDLFDRTRKDPSIAFVSLDMDLEPASIREFLTDFRKKYSFPVLLAGADLKISALPHTWIVDREGFIRETLRGGGAGFAEQALAMAEAVKRRPSVSTIPAEVRDAMRKKNERDALKTR